MVNFYQRFLTAAVDKQSQLTALAMGTKKNDKTPIELNTEAATAFDGINNDERKRPTAQLTLIINA